MAVSGWKATGLLEPLYAAHGGRDGLATLTGVPGTTLSAVNSGGRNLGIEVAEKISAATGVSLLDLGAPEEAATDRRSRRAIDRLRALEAEHALLRGQFDAFVEATTLRLVALEEAPARKGQRSAPQSASPKATPR